MSFGMYLFFFKCSLLSNTTRTLDLFCVFLILDLELTISLRKSCFFYWRMIFRNQELVLSVLCYCSVTDSSSLNGQNWEYMSG